MSFIALIFILEEQTQSRPSFILAHAGKSCGIMIIWLFLTSKAPLYV
jgi:SNF family Na+-dependent transporter